MTFPIAFQFLKAVCRRHAQFALAWILRRKEISSVITGATRVEQLDENLIAAEGVEKLTDDVLEQIEKIVGNLPE